MASSATGPTDEQRSVAGRKARVAAALRHVVRAFPAHLWIFLGLNAALNIANWATGRPWWAFWPLLVTSLLLGLHYIVYKSMVVDQRWVDRRVEELNVKSYDRSHIEDLKSRYGSDP
jgi:hypothetical protein